MKSGQKSFYQFWDFWHNLSSLKNDLQPKRFCALIKNSLHQIGPFSFRSCTAKIARSLKCVYNVQGKQCFSLSSAAAERWWRFVEKGKVCETLPLCFSTSQTVPQLNRESEKKRESCLWEGNLGKVDQSTTRCRLFASRAGKKRIYKGARFSFCESRNWWQKNFSCEWEKFSVDRLESAISRKANLL